ncbi:MAG: peptidylprolyl isomerase [Candidatus Bathyarchaeota archaeon]|nr:peptidylprolyl isomerase [Candidatus Bathyarchaeota archaeon]
MKLSRKAIVSILIIVVLGLSSIVVWTQFFAPPKEVAVFETSLGTIEIQLDRQKAPITVENFVKYVKAGFYNGTVIHRVEPNFVLQGGGFTATAEKTPGTPIKLESNNGLKNLAGTIAMARTSVPDSATSQFFINLVDNTDLDYSSTALPGYAVFGKVVAGMSVVNSIAAVKTGTRGIFLPAYNQTYPFQNWPLQDVVVTGAYMKP